jgi:hypothetical protein
MTAEEFERLDAELRRFIPRTPEKRSAIMLSSLRSPAVGIATATTPSGTCCG